MYTEYRKTGKKELFLRSQEIKEKEIKGKSDFNELTAAIDLISGKFDNYESEKREKYKAIKDLKSTLPGFNTSVKNVENQLDRQEEYSRRNCILIYGIIETQDENNDGISLRTKNKHLEVRVVLTELLIQNQAIKGQDL